MDRELYMCYRQRSNANFNTPNNSTPSRPRSLAVHEINTLWAWYLCGYNVRWSGGEERAHGTGTFGSNYPVTGGEERACGTGTFGSNYPVTTWVKQVT